MSPTKSGDGRSETTRISLDDLRSYHRRMKRLVRQLEVCIGDAEDAGQKALDVQFWASAELAERRLESVSKGVQAATK